ncbi:MAG: tetratricopeptide repeat protein, partial [Thermoplasmata archaeon]|nr:tetratricopeptide repeat protein [Thermoplasmata archaeon]
EPMAGPRDDPHLTEVGEKEGVREAQSWIDLALSLLSLGEEEEALAAYDRAFTLDPARARRSLFQPMLRLVTAAAGEALEDDPGDQGPVGPATVRRTYSPSFSGDRPEVG